MFKNKKVFRLLSLLLAFVFVTFSNITVNATNANSNAALQNLRATVASGNYISKSTQTPYDMSSNTYKTSGGGYLLYVELMDAEALTSTTEPLFNATNFESLTAGAKQRFLKDVFTICNAMADDTERMSDKTNDSVTDETVNSLYEQIQDQTGMGSQMLAALLQNTKPNYVAANRIYAPFSGVIGTILGIISVLIMALLAVTMALDIAYITIPAVQLMFGTGEGGANGGKKASLISQEAINAVQTAGGSGGTAGGGEKQLAITVYFKQRWLGLVVLGICMLYLVQGQIYSFVAWFIDLLSGFLGF